MSHKVEVGDTIRFSAALLQRIHHEPEHLSLMVKVVDLWIGPDGEKVLVLQRRLTPDISPDLIGDKP